jgi:hypothetical protein
MALSEIENRAEVRAMTFRATESALEHGPTAIWVAESRFGPWTDTIWERQRGIAPRTDAISWSASAWATPHARRLAHGTAGDPPPRCPCVLGHVIGFTVVTPWVSSPDGAPVNRTSVSEKL